MTLNAIIANFQTFKIVDLLDIIIIPFLCCHSFSGDRSRNHFEI